MFYELLAKLMGLPVLASEHGKDVDWLIIWMHVVMGALFVGWVAYFIFVIYRFHEKRNPKADYMGMRSHTTSYVEIIVAVVELAILFGLAIPLWAKAVNDLPDESKSVVLRVVAQQFGWNARYPGPDRVFGRQDVKFVDMNNKFGVDQADPHAKDDIETYNDIHVPVDSNVIVHVSSMDVVHSFKVIALRVCQDAIPGLSIPLWFKANQEGRYQINCAQLCGAGHYSMSGGFITIESKTAYESWVKSQSKSNVATSFE